MRGARSAMQISENTRHFHRPCNSLAVSATTSASLMEGHGLTPHPAVLVAICKRLEIRTSSAEPRRMMQMMTFTLELVRPLDRKLLHLKKMKLFKQVVSMRAATLYCSQDASYCVASMRASSSDGEDIFTFIIHPSV